MDYASPGTTRPHAAQPGNVSVLSVYNCNFAAKIRTFGGKYAF